MLKLLIIKNNVNNNNNKIINNIKTDKVWVHLQQKNYMTEKYINKLKNNFFR